jgi:hypothetical protein
VTERAVTAATAAARAKLLAAGRDLLVEHYSGTPDRRRGLRGVLPAALVAERADFASHAVLYRAWQDADGGTDGALDRFVEDVLASMSTWVHAPVALTEALTALHEQHVGFATVVKLMADLELRRLLDPDADGRNWTGWLSVAPYAFDEPLRSTWRAHHERGALLPLSVFYRDALALWDRRMVAPLTEHDLAEALNAAIDGFVLHEHLAEGINQPIDWRPDDDSDDDAPWTLWSMTAYSIITSITEPLPPT